MIKIVTAESLLAPIGTAIDNDMLIEQSTNGCAGCMFESDNYANECGFAKYCIAVKRPDNKSVLFKDISRK